MLAAIATQWQVEGHEPAALAQAMLDPARLRAFVDGLEAGARAALARVAACGGSIRGHLLTSVHGELRRLGPKALERQAPWRNPSSATERLWYAGLLFRRYGRVGAYHGEVFYIPADLLAALPCRPAPAPAIALQPLPPPERPREEGDALALDLEAVLARLRLASVPTGRGGELAAVLLRELGPRLRGSADPERLALVERLALGLRLVVRRGGELQVGAQARSWLGLAAYRRELALFDAWQGDAHWNELWRVPSLRCEATGWRNDPLAARAGVLEALRGCPAGWLSVESLAGAIKETQPDFARPDGDYESWYIRDAATGQYLQGFAHWEAVEGALIAHLVGRSLYWLGAVALGENGVFRLTARGRAFLRLDEPPAAPPPAPFIVGEDLTIRVPRAARAYDRARLERFARWQGREGEVDLYTVDAESAWRALNAGIQPGQVVAFLRRASGGALPAEAVRALRAYGASYGQVTLRQAVLLQTQDAPTLRQLRRDPELGLLLGAVVSERAVLVSQDQLPRVLARLKRLGWWPRLAGLAEPGRGQPGARARAPGRSRGTPPSGGSAGGHSPHSGP